MCIIFFGKSKYGLFISFNRDEAILRETNNLQSIDINEYKQSTDYISENIIYSKDIITNGSFMSINQKNSDFCFLLNHPVRSNPYIADKKLKRGMIPLEFCSFNKNLSIENKDDYKLGVEKYISGLSKNDNEYNGYNIVFGNIKHEMIFYYTNNKEYLNSNIKGYSLPYLFDLSSVGSVFGIGNRSLFEEVTKISYGISLLRERIELSLQSNENELNENDLFKKYLFENIMCCDMKFENNDCIETITDKLISGQKKSRIVIKSFKDYSNLDFYICSSIYVNDNYDERLFYNYGTRQTYLIFKRSEVVDIYESFGVAEKDEKEKELFLIEKKKFMNSLQKIISFNI